MGSVGRPRGFRIRIYAEWSRFDGPKEMMGFIPDGPVRFWGRVYGTWEQAKATALGSAGVAG